MNKKNILVIVLAVLLLVSATVSVTVILNGNNKSFNPTMSGLEASFESTINVTGNSTVSIPADVGYIQIGIDTKDPDVTSAQAQNAETADQIIKAVKKLGLTDDDITTSNYSIYPEYNYSQNDNPETPENYVVSNTVKLRITDLSILGDVIDAAADAGANRAYNIYFDVLDTDDAKNEALERAIQDARAKADILAEAAGVKIVGIQTILDQSYFNGGFYDYAMPVMEDMAKTRSVSTPIMSGNVDVTANVNVIFVIEN